MKKVIIIVNFILIFFIGNLFNVVSFEEITNKNINNNIQKNTKDEPQILIINITPEENSVTIDYVLHSNGFQISSYFLVHPLVNGSVTLLKWDETKVQSATENNLDSNKTYSDWYFIVSYLDSEGNQRVAQYPIFPFTTKISALQLTIENVSTSNNSVTLDWSINDPNNVINSVILNHPNIETGFSDVTDQTTITINGLNPNTTYNDWYFEITYDNNQTIKFNIEPFMTDNIIVPSLIVKTIAVEATSVTFNWTISDPDNTINSIILFHPEVGSGSTNIVKDSNSITIDGLSPETNYQNWYFEITYTLGLEDVSEQIMIESFTTSAKSLITNKYKYLILGLILVLLFLLVIFIFLIAKIILFKKNKV